MQIPFKFKNKKLLVMGTLHLPALYNNFPGIILFHGFTGTKIEPHRFFWKISKSLETRGIASLRFDYRGCGESEGETIDFTIKDYLSDARKAVNKFIKIKGLDKENISVLGLSMGGIIASYIAAEFNFIKKIILVSAVAKPEDIFWKKQKKENPLFLQSYKQGVLDFYGNLFSRKFFNVIRKMNPVEKLRNFDGKALLIHSDTDEVVPIDNMYSFAEVLKDSTKVIIKNSDHTFSNSAHEKEVIDSIVSFLSD